MTLLCEDCQTERTGLTLQADGSTICRRCKHERGIEADDSTPVRPESILSEHEPESLTG